MDKDIYPNNLKNRLLGLAKAPIIDDRKLIRTGLINNNLRSSILGRIHVRNFLKNFCSGLLAPFLLILPFSLYSEEPTIVDQSPEEQVTSPNVENIVDQGPEKQATSPPNIEAVVGQSSEEPVTPPPNVEAVVDQSPQEPVSLLPQTEPVCPTKRNYFPIPKRMTLNHNRGWGEGSIIQRGTDYSTLGIFLAPDYFVGSFYPLIDLRAHRFDNDYYAFSVGIGGRYVPEFKCFCEILGFNVFYDWRQGFLNEYNQLDVGFEILGKRWDFRANGYFPVGQKKYLTHCKFDYEGGFEISEKRHEITSIAYNAEVGWLAIGKNNFLFYIAAGPYYLRRKSCCFEPIIGGRIRVRPQYKDYLAVDVSYFIDSNHNSIWETTFMVSLPLYQIRNQHECPCKLTDRQIYQPIERLEIMTLGYRSCWMKNY